jgi:hypothetical protein
MESLGRVKEETRSTCAGQCSGNLAGYMSRLAHARNNELATAVEDDIYGAKKLFAQRTFQCCESLGLGVYRIACREE